MPEPASAAVPASALVPEIGVPGLVIVAELGAVLSIRVCTVAETVLKPALSVAVARSG